MNRKNPTKLMKQVQQATLQAYSEGELQVQRAILDYNESNPAYRKRYSVPRMTCDYAGRTFQGNQCHCVVGAWLKEQGCPALTMEYMAGGVRRFLLNGEDRRGYLRFRVGKHGESSHFLVRRPVFSTRVYRRDREYLLGVQEAHDKCTVSASQGNCPIATLERSWGTFVRALGLTLAELPFPTADNDPLQVAHNGTSVGV